MYIDEDLLTTTPLGPECMRCVTPHERRKLAAAIAILIKKEPDLDYDNIRPLSKRGFPQSWINGGREPYTPFKTMCKAYSIILECGTKTVEACSSPELDSSNSAKIAFREGLVKVQYVLGKGTEPVDGSEPCIPFKLWGFKHDQYWDHVEDMRSIAFQMEHELIHGKLLPLVLHWVCKREWLEMNSVEYAEERIIQFSQFYDAEGPSLGCWFIESLSQTINRRYYFGKQPTDIYEAASWAIFRSFIRAKVCNWADVVYCGLVDHNPGVISGQRFKQFPKAVTSGLAEMNTLRFISNRCLGLMSLASYGKFEEEET